MAGYINVDSNEEFDPDLQLDFRNIKDYFEPDTADEILIVHAIGYLTLWECEDFLRNCHAILKIDGILIIETPNFDKCINKVSKDFDSYVEGVRGIIGFGMDHLQARESYTPYSFSWNPRHLSRILEIAGFKSISELPPQTHVKWRDMRIEASKKELPIWKKIQKTLRLKL